MKERIACFDYLRAFAILGILLCHFFFNWNETMGLGRFCGNTFNALFIAMSGLLLGMKNSTMADSGYKTSFLRKRFTKLSFVYYPFLVFVFLFYIFVEKNTLLIRDVVMHTAYLPWFDKLSGFEHLWFMTMISMCYIAVFLYSKINESMGKGIVGICFMCSLVIGYFMEEIGLPGQMLLYLSLFLACHYNANYMTDWLKKKNTIEVLTVSILTITSFVYLFYNGLYDRCRLLAEMGGVLCAMAFFSMMVTLLYNVRENKVVVFIAGISFEIYLVHHVFAFGDYSVMNVIDNPILGFLCLLVLSVTLAYILHGVSLMVSKFSRT